jgi:DNA-binding MarR family transcriptional regulator
MLDPLEAHGLIERLADAADRRTKRIRPTHSDAAMLQDIQVVVVELRASLLSDTESASFDLTNLLLASRLIKTDRETA